jgi:hypothetical protein
MLRVWFNKTFSSVAAAIRLIREADTAREYHILCTHTKAFSPVFLAADESAIEPNNLTGKAYLEWCLAFCSEQNIAIFVPGKEAGLISANKEMFGAQGTRVLSVADQKTLELLNDKAAFYHHVNLPLAPPAEFTQFENLEQFETAYADLRERHPILCVKPSVSVYGLGFSILNEARSSAQLLLEGVQYQMGLDDFRRGIATLGEFRTMLLMEYLDGHEYSVDCLADNGRLVCAIPRKKSLLVGHGQTIDVRDDIQTCAAELAAQYNLNGIFNAQFREGRHGLRLLEINARMSGGIGMACLAGANLPYLMLAGFDRGYEGLAIPALNNGIRITEMSLPVIL